MGRGFKERMGFLGGEVVIGLLIFFFFRRFFIKVLRLYRGIVFKVIAFCCLGSIKFLVEGFRGYEEGKDE